MNTSARKGARDRVSASRDRARPPRTVRPLRVLMVASEVSPLLKTGGLADAVAGLSGALTRLGHDVRVLVPGYRRILETSPDLVPEGGFRDPETPEADLLATTLPRSGVGAWLLDHPSFGERGGNPYLDEHGRDYADNDRRFDRLARVAAGIAGGRSGLDWRPDVVHAHDWHAGLTPVRMLLRRVAAACVFTVHNLAYQGLFPHEALDRLELPAWLWHPEALEYYGRFSFMKGGLNFSDLLTTVSPAFAREVLTPAYGEGLEGVLARRAGELTGIVNGLDLEEWNPETDPLITAAFSRRDLSGKARNRARVRGILGLAEEPDKALVAIVGRLADQKGIDLLLGALPHLMRMPVQVAVLGSGQRIYEQALENAAAEYPAQLSVTVGYEERLAHELEAGAELLLMPSRYEPCGLAQMQAMRYGTIPVVRACGGLRDTVVDADATALAQGTATGFAFEQATVQALVGAVRRALELRREPQAWAALVDTAMAADFSWRRSAESYAALYRDALHQHGIAAGGAARR